MPALEEPPVIIDAGPRPERLFDPGGRTLDDVLREIDDALRHGRAAPCLVCGAMDGRRRAQHARRVHVLRQQARVAP